MRIRHVVMAGIFLGTVIITWSLLALFLLWASASMAAGAVNGTAEAVQAAINSAHEGDTIEIAAGTFDWSSGVSIKKFVHLRGAVSGTTIHNVTGGNDWGVAMVFITPASAGSSELSNLTFQGAAGAVAKHVWILSGNGQPPIVHDCHFKNVGFGGRCIEWAHNGGLIYNCEFVSSDKSDSSAIAFKNPGSESAWKEAGTLGDPLKNTYVEDCTFTDLFLQAMDFDDNSRTVVRHCAFNNSAVSSHGKDTSPVGLRQVEFYDNEFIFSLGGGCSSDANGYPLNINYWFYVRGGTGVICNNKFPHISSCMWGSKPSITLTVYNIRRNGGQIPCQTHYPAARQIGQGPDGTTTPLYIWGNTGTGANEIALKNYDPDECGNNQQVTDYLHESRDYFVGTVKAGYTPCAYPHPLRTAGGVPSPSPAPSSSPTPLPTATPSPTPPPSGTSYLQWLNDLSRWIESHPAHPDQ